MAKIVQVSAIDSTMNGLLRKLNEETLKAGHELICVCSEGNNTDSMKQEGFNVVNVNIDRSIRPISNLKSIFQMYRLFRKEKPDIVHLHTPVAAVLGRIASKLARTPLTIYTAHGFYFHDNMSKNNYRFFLGIEKLMAKFFTDFIFTQSEEDHQTALKYNFIDHEKIITISNGVDVNGKFNPKNSTLDEIQALRNEFSISNDDFVISFIGRIVKEKGILDLLEGFNEVNNDKVKLLIIGDRADKERETSILGMLEKYRSRKNIIFTGRRNDINNLLNLSDVFVLPSYREGMPRSIIEAMAMENAIIATNIRGSREEVVNGETGILCNLGAPDELASAINKLILNESLLNDMKKQGRLRAEKLYDEDKVVEIQLEKFRELLGES